jgi:hypothetical protein
MRRYHPFAVDPEAQTMTKHRSACNRSDRVEKAAHSRHVSLRGQQSEADPLAEAVESIDEPPKTVEVAFVGHPILGEFRAVPHGW